MSLYNLLHGHDPNAAKILCALEIDPSQIGRFRDASFVKDGDAYVIRLLCRTGGPNRADHPNSVLTRHPLYLRDHDDLSDSTYALYYFRIPQATLDEIAAQGLALDDLVDPTSLREKTDAAIAAIKDSPTSWPTPRLPLKEEP